MSILRGTKTVWLAALVACALYFSGFLVILTPLPLMYAAMVRGRDAGIASAAISFAAVAMVYLFLLPLGGEVTGWQGFLPVPGAGLAGFGAPGFMPVFGVGYFAFFAAVALALSFGAGKRLPIDRWGGYAILAGAGAMIATVVAAKVICTGSLIEGARSYITYVLGEIAGTDSAMGLEASQLGFLADNAGQVATGILEILPSLAFIYAAIAVAINLVLGRRLLRVRDARARVPAVVGFRLPDWLIWLVITSGGIFFANSYLVGSLPARAMALNVLIGTGALYFLQGMAVTAYFVQRIRFSLVRTVAYIAMIIFLQTVSVALVVLGIADVWADFRLRHLRMLHQQR